MKIDKEKAMALREKGKTYEQIAEALEATAPGIYYALNPGKQTVKKKKPKKGFWKKYYDKDKHREYTRKYREKLRLQSKDQN